MTRPSRTHYRASSQQGPAPTLPALDRLRSEATSRSTPVPGGGDQRRLSLLDRIDGGLFTFAGLSAVWLAYLLLREGARPGWPSLLLVVFWVVFSYLLLPRLHRILTRLYVPGYFIGRTRTSDGLLGDPVNVAWLGREEQVHATMTAAGWTRADDLSLATGGRIVSSTLRRRSYREAPVSPLHLFDRQQDFAYQQEVAGSPSKRHHVRFWHCPDGWMLPGGFDVDWLAAGTYDRSVGLSLFTFQVTHKIEADTDVERDFIVDSVTSSGLPVQLGTIRNFSTGYHSRNGGGDVIQTDGDLPVIDLGQVASPPAAAAPPTDSRDQRPVQTAFGAGVALLRAALFVCFGVLFAVDPGLLSRLEATEPTLVDDDRLAVVVIVALLRAALFVCFGVLFAVDPGLLSRFDATEPSLVDDDRLAVVVIVALLFGGAAVLEAGLGLAVLVGRNWARLLLMLSCVITTVAAFTANLQGSELVTLVNLPTVASGILVLLALSSHRARDYAARDLPPPATRCRSARR